MLIKYLFISSEIFCCLSLTVFSQNVPVKKELRVLKKNGMVYIRSPFSKQEDLVVRVGSGTGNKQVDFKGVYLLDTKMPFNEESVNSGRLIHTDGACPVCRMNGTVVGGNHGPSVGLEINCSGHGRTIEDIGSEWKDSEGNKFYLLRITSEDKLLFLSENKPAGNIWNFKRHLAGTTLKSTSANAELAFNEKRWGVQIYPSCRVRKQEYLVDGRIPLKEGEIISCKWLDIIEEYDIINPGSLLADIIAHPGQERDFTAEHLKAVLNYNVVYHFTPDGSNTVFHRVKALQEFRMDMILLFMTRRLYPGDYDTLEYYVPKTLPFTQDNINYDFRAIQDYSFRLPSPLIFNAGIKNISDPENPPDRFIQFLGRKKGDDIVREVGFALGYSLLHGISVPSVRIRNTGNFLWLYTTSKTYPLTGDQKMGIIPAGTELSCLGYRHYFDPRAGGNATCLYWNKQEKDTVVYIDYHKSVDKDVIKLPAEFTGKKLEVVEKTSSVTLHTAGIVPAKGVTVTVTGGYGYIVLKLS